jgi:predicted butyrate kinase (DUF1464 family)
MASSWETRASTAGYGVQLAGVVLGCTLLLTAAFVGVLAIVTGGTPGIGDRLPYYALVMGLAFVAAILVTDGEVRDPLAGLRIAVGVAAGTLVGVVLAGEGVTYVLANSQRLLASQLLFYFVAAGLVGTGLGYWVVRNWQDIRQSTTGTNLGR